MEEVKYIPGDLVMTNGTPIGTKKGVAYVVTASDPNRTLILKDGTVNKGVVTLDAVTEEDKAYFFETSTWVKHIVPIPLTQAILEANGWETQNKWYYFLDINRYAIRHLGVDFEHKSPKGNLYVEANGDHVIEIQYCHQLQHLLFGLGLNSELKV